MIWKEDIELIEECISDDVFDEAEEIRQIYERNYKKITGLLPVLKVLRERLLKNLRLSCTKQ